jgi:CRP/FNR family transcriptional regulator, cyclic AMP receptor protein
VTDVTSGLRIDQRGSEDAATDRTVVASEASFLDGLDPEPRRRLQETAWSRAVRAGDPIFSPATAWTRVAIVRGGLARAYLTAVDGRQLTVRYVRPGDVIGSVFSLAGDRAPLAISAVTDCEILELDPDQLLAAVDSDPRTARVVVQLFSRRLEDLYATLAAMAFGSVRERLAGHLLELAQPDDASGRLAVGITQQQLADSVGTVREVVARVLRELRDEGLVATADGRIVILDADRLAAGVGRWRTLSTR